MDINKNIIQEVVKNETQKYMLNEWWAQNAVNTFNPTYYKITGYAYYWNLLTDKLQNYNRNLTNYGSDGYIDAGYEYIANSMHQCNNLASLSNDEFDKYISPSNVQSVIHNLCGKGGFIKDNDICKNTDKLAWALNSFIFINTPTGQSTWGAVCGIPNNNGRIAMDNPDPSDYQYYRQGQFNAFTPDDAQIVSDAFYDNIPEDIKHYETYGKFASYITQLLSAAIVINSQIQSLASTFKTNESKSNNGKRIDELNARSGFEKGWQIGGAIGNSIGKTGGNFMNYILNTRTKRVEQYRALYRSPSEFVGRYTRYVDLYKLYRSSERNVIYQNGKDKRKAASIIQSIDWSIPVLNYLFSYAVQLLKIVTKPAVKGDMFDKELEKKRKNTDQFNNPNINPDINKNINYDPTKHSVYSDNMNNTQQTNNQQNNNQQQQTN